MQRNERGVQRYSSFITVTRLRIDASSHGETANSAAASAKYELVTYAYYVRTFKYYPPAIYHGQGLARYADMIWPHAVAAWAQTNIRCQKVKIVTPRRNANTQRVILLYESCF